MIGGIIILSLFLTALVAMITVSQQFDTYQNVANAMSQKDIDRYSERLMAVDPGLIYFQGNPVSGCGGSCNQYNMTLSNVGGVGVQIVRVYINSTSSGCTQATGYCVLNPSTTSPPSAYTFKVSEGFLNAGEFVHTVRLWLPNTVTLPPNSGANTIWIVTARGRVFTFQWPFLPNPLAKPGTIPDLMTGVMKIAYTGTDISQTQEGIGLGGYCHSEPKETLPGPGNATTGSNALGFVNPWITKAIFLDVTNTQTTLWMYAHLNNTTGKTLMINSGSVFLETADSHSNSKQFFLGADYFGTVYPIVRPPGQNITYANVTIPVNQEFMLIFKVTGWEQDLKNKNTGADDVATHGDIFMGTGSANNGGSIAPLLGKWTKDTYAEGNTYTSIFFFLEGVYIRTQCP
jgi:hypothetical protein